mmetsp:Transcript_7008/g.21226  ORF Transcript_7008/g.21226 Transcript_7008/m.21226 type:complete len:200 (+) Transcript_7008:89-688(+)
MSIPLPRRKATRQTGLGDHPGVRAALGQRASAGLRQRQVLHARARRRRQGRRRAAHGRRGRLPQVVDPAAPGQGWRRGSLQRRARALRSDQGHGPLEVRHPRARLRRPPQIAALPHGRRVVLTLEGGYDEGAIRKHYGEVLIITSIDSVRGAAGHQQFVLSGILRPQFRRSRVPWVRARSENACRLARNAFALCARTHE